MAAHFDLWDYGDVSLRADTIAIRVSIGQMPCDGAWSPDKVALFQRWVDTGKQR